MLHLRIEDEARRNDAFRSVLHTGTRSQVVVMTLQPGEDIGVDLHDAAEEILSVVEGQGELTVAGETDVVVAGSMVVVPRATERNLLNTGTAPLRLVVLYTPPAHADGTRHETKADAVGVDAFDLSDEAQHAEGLAAARDALGRGALVVMPTDTVYGLAANAFDPQAVADLRQAQGRDDSTALPMLVDSIERLDGLVSEVTPTIKLLLEAYWPGALTVTFRAHPSLPEHLSDAAGRVSVRMPQHPVALDLLAGGPLVVTGANKVRRGTKTDIGTAMTNLGAAVAVYLDDRTADGPVPSTIIDGTGPRPRLLRAGAVPPAALEEVAGELDQAL